jgi:hypothetical protein
MLEPSRLAPLGLTRRAHRHELRVGLAGLGQDNLLARPDAIQQLREVRLGLVHVDRRGQLGVDVRHDRLLLD